MPEFLLEVGYEEMPASWLPGLTQQLGQRFAENAARERLEPAEVRAFSTPRRLVLVAQVASRQSAREEQVFGPALRAAKDAAGKWTPAAEGFARKNNVAPADLGQAAKDPAKPDDLSLVFVRKTAGRDSADVLPALIGQVLRSLAFPKRMSWDAWIDDGKGAFPFGRPIRWMVALLAGQVVPFAIHGLVNGEKGPVVVQSGRQTFGHRFLPPDVAGRPIPVDSFADLQERLRRSFVLLDSRERLERIRQQLTAMHGDDVLDHPLVEEWSNLVEFPTVLEGRMPPTLSGLPGEVLTTVLEHHQKYILLGGIGSRFAGVTNADAAHGAQIVRGMERVVVARLRDATFFFAEDSKRPLAERVDDLAGVTFHQGLGTYKDKALRLERLIQAMRPGTGTLGELFRTMACRAARLAKADLTTLMVREFPELQGVMGAIYLGREGEAVEVVDAVRWHYHPIAVEEDAPPAGKLSEQAMKVFAPVSLADKLDTLAGYFGVGLVPTGSSDPYGLRRAAQGVIRVLMDFWKPDERPSLRQLIVETIRGYGDRLKRSPADIAHDLETFLLDRVRYVLSARGFPSDEVEAVLGAREPDALENPHECLLRLEALSRVRAQAKDDFEHLAVAFKRAKNILEKEQAPAAIEPKLFESDAERELHAAVGRLSVRDGSYEDRLRALAGLRGPVDRFFDDVLVMAEDEKLRRNRLGLLQQTVSLFYRIADISKLGGSI